MEKSATRKFHGDASASAPTINHIEQWPECPLLTHFRSRPYHFAVTHKKSLRRFGLMNMRVGRTVIHPKTGPSLNADQPAGQPASLIGAGLLTDRRFSWTTSRAKNSSRLLW